MSHREEAGKASKSRVTDALQRALEGELVEVAYAPSRIGADMHSKTGVSHHSKGGNDHSKSTVVPSVNQDPVRDAKYLKFAEELARVKSAIDQES